MALMITMENVQFSCLLQCKNYISVCFLPDICNDLEAVGHVWGPYQGHYLWLEASHEVWEDRQGAQVSIVHAHKKTVLYALIWNLMPHVKSMHIRCCSSVPLWQSTLKLMNNIGISVKLTSLAVFILCLFLGWIWK